MAAEDSLTRAGMGAGAGEGGAAPLRPGRPLSGAASAFGDERASGADGAPALEARLAGSLNPLLTAAAPLLDRVARLRDRLSHEDPDALRAPLLEDLARFEEEATRAGIGADEVRVGRFALCATVDDVLRATPWGGRCPWIREGLLSVVEPGAGGPQRFFDFLDRMLSDPRLHRRELELFYACLSLGFEGNHRLRARGSHDLSHLRDELYRVLRRMRGERSRTLSPGWRGVRERFRPLGLTVPGWAAAAAAVALLAGLLHAGLSADLDRSRAELERRIAGLLPARPVEIARFDPPPASAGPALAARVAAALAPEIRGDAVAVLAADDGALVVRVSGPGMFATGGDALRARHRAVVDRVGQALAAEPGRLLVIGYAEPDGAGDGLALARARAESVRLLLERHAGAGRLTVEARPAPAVGGGPRVDVRLYPR
ncbi:type IVB secretion system protein IcmH/DotU [Azospirillum sp. SYSU D00513]|uniref:type IVB secretion system protein IcmH/DotU n=1 Tax=Azospirillum sp. SYSU D00513 TaxID=2812561 RepID=UPI001A976271|nr:type IVB secretion system protein IcmH/DotU [Azospirillum sp. SYSU D00513]